MPLMVSAGMSASSSRISRMPPISAAHRATGSDDSVSCLSFLLPLKWQEREAGYVMELTPISCPL